MNKYLRLDPWRIIEEGFDPQNNRSSESIFSLGNGYMGQRANFEERYSGDMLLGNYIVGVYYPDPTKVGWWKNGYPEFYARIVNAANWLATEIKIGTETLDLAKCKISKFTRILHMREGYLERSFVAELPSNKQLKVNAQRFLSLVDKKIGYIQYSVTPLNFSGELTIEHDINTDVRNESSNWNEKFLNEISKEAYPNGAHAVMAVRKNDIQICTGVRFNISGKINCIVNKPFIIYKCGANITSRDHKKNELVAVCEKALNKALDKGYETMFEEHKAEWEKRWQQNDIIIEGDLPSQQAIRFNIFQLLQTYTGEDPRLNVGPKGFTGEKYGATTQWDSEAYCLPFYLSTHKRQVAENLLLYRHNHLPAAIENADNLGYKNGAALFPMATVDGKECQNEWEITFEEIHRQGAIAYAIYNYIRYTDDKDYLTDYGLEILIAISRYWQQRVSFSREKNQYVILGVTGPNEYENNINNNWYTNTIACWTLEYTLQAIAEVKQAGPNKYAQLIKKLNFEEQAETAKWQEIIVNMYFPIDKKLGIFLQQEGYFDKEQIMADELEPQQRPLNQNWSWDRILRSCFIKQADVLQGVYFFQDKYDTKTIKRNFDFYEPRTVHESSLSPCIHSLLAARIGYKEQAYELFLRTSRLDLDDYNNEISEGCHITSMAGSWLALIHGFAGMLVKNNTLSFNPIIIPQWKYYLFKILFRKNSLKITISHKTINIVNESSEDISLLVFNKPYKIVGSNHIIIAME